MTTARRRPMPCRIYWLLPIAWCALSAQPRTPYLGKPPSGAIDVLDLYTAFNLPPLRDTPGGGLASVLSTTHVGTRATMLGVNGQSALDAWTTAATLLQNPPVIPSRAPASSTCTAASTASGINRQFASGCKTVVFTAASMALDQPIEVESNGVTLDLGRTVLVSAGAAPYLLRIENTHGVTVTGGVFQSAEAGILVNASDTVLVQDVEIHDLTSDGIVVTGSTHVSVTGAHIRGVSGAGILLHRGTAFSIVQDNDVEAGTFSSNMTAGILITDREVDLASDPLALFEPDGYGVVSEPIVSLLHPPHDNAIVYNRVMRNLASGIYVDGGIRNVIVSNIIEGNSKEGLCLDNGSAGNVVASNIVEHNGNRWGEPDWVLAKDAVLTGGRLPDGTPAEKVPGISLDNAMYNFVFANNVAHNYGGGVKLVRTGYFNLIGLNNLLSDNDGAGEAYHFFGVELGATPVSDPELDATPSQGNQIFSNPIRGNHYSGIFFDSGSDQNDILENTILDAQHWALESVAVMNNNSLNNLTNLPSRNIGSGLNPSLVTSGQPVLDSGGQ